MPNIEIRKAVVGDVPVILRFVTELAAYEKALNEVVATEDDIRTSLFSKSASAQAIICHMDGGAIGFAVYFYNYSTWLGKNGLYLEDLYVSPDKRGIGAGKALLKYLAQTALDNNCGRFEWSVLDWNAPAIEFYHSIGAKPQSEWVGYRLTGEALMELADS